MFNNIQALTEISVAEGQANRSTHSIGNIEGVNRCIHCEIGSWNAWKELCSASQR